MSESKTTEILKHAILLEKRGRAFYLKISEDTKSDAVRSFFKDMADEEKNHIEILSDQLKSYTTKGFLDSDLFNIDEIGTDISQILSKEIIDNISAAGFEAAAISAAISMEKRAVKIYTDRAETATDPEEKKLYEWLSKWEKGHRDMLMDMDKALIEKVWFDNNFWPF
ncbi:MAG: ferritin family protein [Desulfobacterales bacterium]|nr:ferritin family protein [Desulfobacterales bacterium]